MISNLKLATIGNPKPSSSCAWLAFALIPVIMLLSAERVVAWPFEPGRDAFSSESLLDLRKLNEKEAGMAGWLKADGQGRFLLGDGTPVRFWAVNTTVGRERPFVARPRWGKKEPELAYHARWLAKRGVNMVRCHAFLNPDPKKQSAGPDGPKRSEIEWIWRTVAAMKGEGIYTTISPYWANQMKTSPTWGLGDGDFHNRLFFDKKLQAAYKNWLRVLFTEKNDILGGRLADDPALGIFQIQNEDSLLFWTFNGLKGEPRKDLGREFARWATRKHGSSAKAIEHWGERLKGDAPEQGVLDFYNIWNVTRDGYAKHAGKPERKADQVAFLVDQMRAFNREIARYVHEDLGCPVLVNAGNWRTADTVTLTDAERHSYAVTEVMAANRYFTGQHIGKNNGWAIVKGDRYSSRSALTDAFRALPTNLRQPEGFPMIIPEGNWVPPNDFIAEGPFLVAAYGALCGIDGYYWFSTNTDGWVPPRSANGYFPSQAKWIIATPEIAGQFPATALLYRRGDLREAKPAVVEHRHTASIFGGKSPGFPEEPAYDPNRDESDGPRGLDKALRGKPAFLVGPVRVRVSDKKPEQVTLADGFANCFDGNNKDEIRALTGEIVLDPVKGICRIDSPRAQGVAAHFRNQARVQVSDLIVESRIPYATVIAIALDDQPLRKSRRILVQAGLPAKPTGWAARPVEFPVDKKSVPGFEITSHGGPPWNVTAAEMTILLRAPAVTRARVLDPNGMPMRELELTRQGSAWKFEFPHDALYVVLEE